MCPTRLMSSSTGVPSLRLAASLLATCRRMPRCSPSRSSTRSRANSGKMRAGGGLMLTRAPLAELRRMRALPGLSGSTASSSDTPKACWGSIEATASTSAVVTASGPCSMGSSQLSASSRASQMAGSSRVTGFDLVSTSPCDRRSGCARGPWRAAERPTAVRELAARARRLHERLVGLPPVGTVSSLALSRSRILAVPT